MSIFVKKFIKDNYHRNIPKEIRILIYEFTFSDLIITMYTVLKSDVWHIHKNIIIKECGTLTSNGYDDNTKNGGKLYLYAEKSINLIRYGKISMNNKGYYGGKPGYQGSSYNSIGKYIKRINNLGGGGYDIEYAGGGGYGSNGFDGKLASFVDGYGGSSYGDSKLTILHLGSGGGGSTYYGSYGYDIGDAVQMEDGRTGILRYMGSTTWSNETHLGIELHDYTGDHDGAYKGVRYFTCPNQTGIIVEENDTIKKYVNGGNGGGAIKIICNQLSIDNNSGIYCNGGNGNGYSGGGSGGSIWIVCNTLNNLGTISACGGESIKQYGTNGNGGIGRIRIDTISLDTKGFIDPSMFYTHKLISNENI